MSNSRKRHASGATNYSSDADTEPSPRREPKRLRKTPPRKSGGNDAQGFAAAEVKEEDAFPEAAPKNQPVEESFGNFTPWETSFPSPPDQLWQAGPSGHSEDALRSPSTYGPMLEFREEGFLPSGRDGAQSRGSSFQHTPRIPQIPSTPTSLRSTSALPTPAFPPLQTLGPPPPQLPLDGNIHSLSVFNVLPGMERPPSHSLMPLEFPAANWPPMGHRHLEQLHRRPPPQRPPSVHFTAPAMPQRSLTPMMPPPMPRTKAENREGILSSADIMHAFMRNLDKATAAIKASQASGSRESADFSAYPGLGGPYSLENTTQAGGSSTHQLPMSYVDNETYWAQIRAMNAIHSSVTPPTYPAPSEEVRAGPSGSARHSQGQTNLRASEDIAGPHAHGPTGQTPPVEMPTPLKRLTTPLGSYAGQDIGVFSPVQGIAPLTAEQLHFQAAYAPTSGGGPSGFMSTPEAAGLQTQEEGMQASPAADHSSSEASSSTATESSYASESDTDTTYDAPAPGLPANPAPAPNVQPAAPFLLPHAVTWSYAEEEKRQARERRRAWNPREVLDMPHCWLGVMGEDGNIYQTYPPTPCLGRCPLHRDRRGW